MHVVWQCDTEGDCRLCDAGLEFLGSLPIHEHSCQPQEESSCHSILFFSCTYLLVFSSLQLISASVVAVLRDCIGWSNALAVFRHSCSGYFTFHQGLFFIFSWILVLTQCIWYSIIELYTCMKCLHEPVPCLHVFVGCQYRGVCGFI